MRSVRTFVLVLLLFVVLFLGGYYFGRAVSGVPDAALYGLLAVALVALLLLTAALRRLFGTVAGRVDDWYHALFDRTPDIVTVIDRSGAIEYINQTFPPHRPEELIGTSVYEYVHGSHRAQVQEAIASVLAEGQPVTYEVRLPTRDGHGWYASHAAPVVRDGSVIGVTLVNRDISQQRIMNDALKDAVQQKSDFVSVVAHQLRDPIAVLRWNLELLAEEDADQLPPSVRDVLEDMRRANAYMNDLVSDLLLMSRLEQQRIPLNLQTVFLGPLVQEVVDLLRHKAEARQITVRVTAPVSPQITADPVLLRQAVHALVSNAIKYSPEGSDVRVEVGEQSRHAMVMVADHGIGIPKKDQRRVFEKFYRAENATRYAGAEGTGLGLSIAKQLVELMQGTIHLESVEGHGSTFIISIPIMQ